MPLPSMPRLTVLSLLLLSVLAAPLKADEAEDVAMDMVAAWNAVDLDRVISLFTPDGVLHSMMTDPVTGREQLRHHLQPLFNGIEELTLNLRNVVVDGDTVFLERVDEFVFNGKPGAVPVVGVLVIRDGAVAEWREYYDLSQLYGEMGMPVPQRNAAAASTEQPD